MDQVDMIDREKETELPGALPALRAKGLVSCGREQRESRKGEGRAAERVCHSKGQ